MSQRDRYTIRLPFLRVEARRADLGPLDATPDDELETLIKLNLTEPIELTPVTGQSQVPVRRAVERLARYFKREFEYDTVQYGARECDPNTQTVAYIWTEDDYHDRLHESGALVFGACCFRWREYTDHPPAWALQWIWFHPYERDQGHLTRAWPFFKSRFGQFDVESPLSRAMETFLAKMEKHEQEVREGR